jgi:hypothetical protein
MNASIAYLRTLTHRVSHAAHSSDKPLHLAYLALVGIESHYTYSYVAIGLAIATLLSWKEC